MFFLLTVVPPSALYTLSLHDALPILLAEAGGTPEHITRMTWYLTDKREYLARRKEIGAVFRDRKSTRLNSSHRCISYAVFCLKKKINTLICFTYVIT